MTPLDRPLIAFTSAASIAVVLAIGLFAAWKTRTARDYFIAGGRRGLLVTGLATTTAAFSGYVFVGGPGLTYSLGTTALLICLPIGFTGTILCWAVGDPLWRLAHERGVMTIPDAIAVRYGEGLPRALCAGAILVGSLAYLGTQILALGIVSRAVFGLSPSVSIVVGVAVLLAYCTFGGMLAGVYTDVVQGVLMIAAAIAVTACAVVVTGGPAAALEQIRASPEFGPSFLDPFTRDRLVTAGAFLFVFGIGPLGQPHLLHKLFMLKDRKAMRRLPLVIGSTQSLCILLWISIGLAVPALVAGGQIPPLENPDDATPLFLLRFTPEPVAALAFAGLLAAFLSTADSLVNVAAAAIVRDLPLAFGRVPRRTLAHARLATLALAPAAGLFAWLYGDLVGLLGNLAFGTFAAALAPAIAVGLRWRRVSRRAACASMVTGIALSIALDAVLDAPGLAAAVALAASFAVLLAITLATPEPASRTTSST